MSRFPSERVKTYHPGDVVTAAELNELQDGAIANRSAIELPVAYPAFASWRDLTAGANKPRITGMYLQLTHGVQDVRIPLFGMGPGRKLLHVIVQGRGSSNGSVLYGVGYSDSPGNDIVPLEWSVSVLDTTFRDIDIAAPVPLGHNELHNAFYYLKIATFGSNTTPISPVVEVGTIKVFAAPK